MQLKCLNFLQGGRERFLCAVPFRDLLQKFFPELLDTAGKKVSAGEQQAAMQAYGQRGLNVKRAEDIARYVAANDAWILPPIVLSLNGDAVFDPKKGKLTVSEEVLWHIVDGQHRTAGAILAYLKSKKCEFECLPAMVIISSGKSADRQAFADINGNSCKVTLGKNVLFNGRDERARWVQNLEDNALVKDFCDFKNTTPKGGKVFCVAGLYAMAQEFASEAEFITAVQTSGLALKAHVESGIFGSVVVQTAVCRVAAMGSGAIAETIEQIFYKCDWRRECWEGVCVFNGALSKSAKLVNDTAQRIRKVMHEN